MWSYSIAEQGQVKNRDMDEDEDTPQATFLSLPFPAPESLEDPAAKNEGFNWNMNHCNKCF